VLLLLQMHHIIYLSWASAPLTDDQLQELLCVARRRNKQLNVTGIMIYGNERFMQVLEGEEATVRALYEHIKRDARHHHITAYADKPIAHRAFAEWAMAFQAATPQQFEEMAGYLVPSEVTIDISRLPMTDVHLIDILRSFTLP
jgi:hypothetical protein